MKLDRVSARMSLLPAIGLAMAMVSGMAQSAPVDPRKTMKTVAGVLRVHGSEPERLLLNGKPLAGVEDDSVTLLQRFALKGDEVIAVFANCGGNGCTDGSVHLVTVSPGGKVTVSEAISGGGEDGSEANIAAVGDTIVVTTSTGEGTNRKALKWVLAGGKLTVPAEIERERAAFRAAAAAAPAPPAPKSPLIGDWTCQSRKSNGSIFQSAFRFAPDGGFAYVDPQSRMFGTYESSGPATRVAVTQTHVGGRVSNAGMDIAIGTVSAAPGQLRFEMTLVRLGAITANACVTVAVAAATPAPQVDVCKVNPAACAAIQRNSDVRNQVQDERCAILRSQLRGTPAGDYQLAKAGCR
jgi:hypothetical protein